MKKRMIALSLSSILVFGCGSSKPVSNDCCKTETTETQIISGEDDPTMKLLLSGIIILAINLMIAR
jgi:hypothetical protein|tara:strand:+ start:198 stop:395 length:198 start_codon:yes stop_codon:yes gene_type:complete